MNLTTCISCLMALGWPAAALATDLDVSVIDRHGRSVDEVVVTVKPSDRHPASAPAASAVMDQLNIAFVPRVLVVPVGAKVEFPNNDNVSHQVYSFSEPKKFHLPLYKGEPHAPVIFEREGLVVLGCNIHDKMVGYVYVTEAPFFGKTDAAGVVHFHNLPPGEYRLTAWSPFIDDAPPTMTRLLHVDGQAPDAERFDLRRELRAQPEPRAPRGDWEY